MTFTIPSRFRTLALLAMTMSGSLAPAATLNYGWTTQQLIDSFNTTNLANESLSQWALYDLFARPVICSASQTSNCLTNVSILQAVSPTFSGTGGYTTSDDDWGASVTDTPDGNATIEWVRYYDLATDVLNYGTAAFVTQHLGPIDVSTFHDFMFDSTQTHANNGTQTYNIPMDAVFSATISTTDVLPQDATVRWYFYAFGERVSGGAGKFESFEFYQDAVAAPEPSTAVLLLTGMALVAYRTRRRRQ